MKKEEYLLQTVKKEDIEDLMTEKQQDGWRLVQMHANCTDEGWEVFYSVGKELAFENFKVILRAGEHLHSISPIFPSASLYEDEMKELFGVDIRFIEEDYNNHLYRINKKTPFKQPKKAGATGAKVTGVKANAAAKEPPKAADKAAGTGTKTAPKES